MVSTLALRIDLLDDLVLSASAASSGGHQGLSHIPGAALRGLFAGELYGKPGIDSYHLFHSGEVRFGDGWPIGPKNWFPALPMPLSLHYAKKDEALYKTRDTLNCDLVHNRAREAGAVEQPEPIRKGYLDPACVQIVPLTDLRMKTAINAQTGRSAEAQLFGYQGLVAGQSFLALIEGPDPALDRLRQVVEQRHFRLGRSRQAEYGRVAIEEVERSAELAGSFDQAAAGDDLVFWALSDLALVDGCGMPSLDPDPEAFCGTAGYRFAPERSWLRTRRYLPWNGHWRMPEVERVVIAAGSVLVFESEDDQGAPPPATPARWVGVLNEAGFGRVWANPKALADVVLARWSGVRVAMSTRTPRPSIDSQDDALLSWLRDRHHLRTTTREGVDRLRAAMAEITGHYAAAAALEGLEDQGLVGPSVSQWRLVATTVSKASSAGALEGLLFEKDKGVAREKDAAWRQRFSTAPGDTFGGWLKLQVEKVSKIVDKGEMSWPDARQYLHRLADAIADQRQAKRK